MEYFFFKYRSIMQSLKITQSHISLLLRKKKMFHSSFNFFFLNKHRKLGYHPNIRLLFFCSALINFFYLTVGQSQFAIFKKKCQD